MRGAAAAVLVLVIGAASAVTTPGNRVRNSRSGQSIVFPDDSSASVAWSLRDGPSGKLISGHHHLYRSGGQGSHNSHGRSASQSTSSSFASSQSEAQSASRESGGIVFTPANEYTSQAVLLPEPEDDYQQTIIHYGDGNQQLNVNSPPHAVNLLSPNLAIQQSQQFLLGELIAANKNSAVSSAKSSSSSSSHSNSHSSSSSSGSSSSSEQLTSQEVPGLIFPGSSVSGFGDGIINHVTGIPKSSSESHSQSSSSQSSSSSASHSSSQSASHSAAHVSSAQVPSLVVPSSHSSSQSSSSAAATTAASQSNSHSSAKTLNNGQILSQSSSHSSGASSNGLSHSSSSSQSSSGSIAQEPKQTIAFGDGFVPIQQLQVSVPLVDTGLQTADNSLSSFGSSTSQYSHVLNGYNSGSLYNVENVQDPTHSYGITEFTNNVIPTGPTGPSFSESASQSSSSAATSALSHSASESSSQSNGNSFVPGNTQTLVPNNGQLIHILPTVIPHSEKHFGSSNSNAHSSSQFSTQTSGHTQAIGDLQLPLQNGGYFEQQISSIPLTDEQSYSSSSSQSSNAASSTHSSSESKSQSSGQHLISANLQAPVPDIGFLGQIGNEQFIAGGPIYSGGDFQSNSAASASQSSGESNIYNSVKTLNGGHLVPIQGVGFAGNLGGNSPIIGGQSHSGSHSLSSSASSGSQSSSASNSHSSEQALSNGILQLPIEGINIVGNVNNAVPTAVGQTYSTSSSQSNSAASSSSLQSASESSAFSTGDHHVPIQLLPLAQDSSSGLPNTGAQSFSSSGSHSSAGAAVSKASSQSGSVASGGNAAYSQSSSSGESVGLGSQQSFSQSSSGGGSAISPAIENGLLVTPANSYSGSTSQASSNSADYTGGLSANVGSSSQAYTSGQAENGFSSSSSSSSSGTYNPSEGRYPQFGKFLPYGFPGLLPSLQQPLPNQLININSGNAESASHSKSSSFSSSGSSLSSSSSSSASSSSNNIPIPLNGFYGLPVSPLQGVPGSSSFSSSASSSRGSSSSSSASSSSSSSSGVVVKQPFVAGSHFVLPGSLCRFSGC